MKPYSPSPTVAIAIIATQLLGPAALWAAEERGIRPDANRQIVVSALNGDQLTLQRESGASPLQFREVLAEGARVSTGSRTTAELLISNRVLVTLGNETTAQVRTVSADQTMILVTKGTVRVAAAASAIGSQGLVTVQTPTSQVQTRGGIVRVAVEVPVGKAEQPSTGAQAYQASYRPEKQIAVAPISSDLIHIEEGMAEIPGAGPSGGPLTVQAGQRIFVQAGKVGSVAETGKFGTGTTGILVTTAHTQTPKEGRDHLVALQIDQASLLGKALTGSAETAEKELEKKTDTKNVINGATGGGVGAGLVSALFGSGTAADPSASNPIERLGSNHGGSKNNQFLSATSVPGKIPTNENSALLVLTRKDPVEPFVKNQETINGQEYEAGMACDEICLGAHIVCDEACQRDPIRRGKLNDNIGFRPYVDPDTKTVTSISSTFKVEKELILIGGNPNVGRGGIPPKEALIVRGVEGSNRSIFFTDRRPANIGLFEGTPQLITRGNSSFVVQNVSKETPINSETSSSNLVGGTLGGFSSSTDPKGLVVEDLGGKAQSRIDAAITATTASDRPKIVLSGGVILDQRSTATIGRTEATSNYFDLTLNPLVDPTNGKLREEDARLSGALLAVIKGPNSTPTVLSMQARMLGVYDGSIINSDGGNKALLSVLDAKLEGPGSSIPLIDITAGKHFTVDNSKEEIEVTESEGTKPSVTVTSAVVTRSTIKLDGALLEASAPLVALTKATMTTASHFADLAGNQAQSVKLGDALVALNASRLIITSGHLLNLNNATAAIGGYLFSLTNNSSLQINDGSLFSLNNSSYLALTGKAFGVFGDAASTLTIKNNLCSTGPCGDLVNSAGQDIKLNGATIRVAGASQDVVLPNNFNVFAGNDAAKVTIGKNAALFKVDPTSTLTIHGTKVR